MDISEKWGDDVEAAVELALRDLDATREEVEITVLEEPSKGFLGLGAKLARVRVERKNAVQAKEPDEKKEKLKTNTDLEKSFRDSDLGEQASATFTPRSDEIKKAKTAKKKPNIDRYKELEVLEDHPAKEFMSDLLRKMELNVDLEVKTDGETIFLLVSGEDSGTVIGKRGQTLDALQYITGLAVNKGQKNHTRIVLDVEDYRARREETLERLAFRLAKKVAKSRRPLTLEPMNPYERKVIHSALQTDEYVTTRSEGKDPYRKVIIELK